jgi:hypothetical protein
MAFSSAAAAILFSQQFSELESEIAYVRASSANKISSVHSSTPQLVTHTHHTPYGKQVTLDASQLVVVPAPGSPFTVTQTPAGQVLSGSPFLVTSLVTTGNITGSIAGNVLSLNVPVAPVATSGFIYNSGAQTVAPGAQISWGASQNLVNATVSGTTLTFTPTTPQTLTVGFQASPIAAISPAIWQFIVNGVPITQAIVESTIPGSQASLEYQQVFSAGNTLAIQNISPIPQTLPVGFTNSSLTLH